MEKSILINNSGNRLEINTIKNSHQKHRPNLIVSLIEREKSQLINDFIVEMDAKNEAYFFILESGNFDAFRKYVYTKRVKNIPT